LEELAAPNLRQLLLDFLSALPAVRLAGERQALVSYAGFDYLSKKINWEGSALTFCNGLVAILSGEGKETLLKFLAVIKDSDWIGIDREKDLLSLCSSIEALSEYEWNRQFHKGQKDFEQEHLIPLRIFIQYLNPEMLLLYGITRSLGHSVIYREAMKLTKYALLLSQDSIVLPASYLFEVPFIEAFVRELSPLRSNGLLYFASSRADLEEYVEKKRTEYPDHQSLFPGYVKGFDSLTKKTARNLLWIPRVGRSAFHDIATTWRRELGDGEGVWANILRRIRERRGSLPTNIEAEIDSIPDKLKDRAFIARFAEELLPVNFTPVDLTQMNILINRAYLESYLEEYSAAIIVNTPLGGLDCGISHVSPFGYIQRISFHEIMSIFRTVGLTYFIENSLGWAELIALRDDFAFRWIVTQAFLDLVDPAHLLRLAVLKSGYRPPAPPFNYWQRRPLELAKDIIWNFYQAVEPVLSDYEPVNITWKSSKKTSNRLVNTKLMHYDPQLTLFNL